MGAAENLATHSAWTAAEDQQDLTRHHKFVHDDIVVNQAGADPLVGLDEYIAMMETTYAGFPDFGVVLDTDVAPRLPPTSPWHNSEQTRPPL